MPETQLLRDDGSVLATVSIDMVGKPFGGEVVVSVNINLDGQPPVSVLFTVDEVRVRSGSAP
jgi:hypothetical protein